MRAQFYSATTVDLGYQNGCYGFGENTLTWAQVHCYVIPPQNAATMRVQLWLVQQSGWVVFDDLTVDDLTVPDQSSTAPPRVRQGVGATNSYYFNGQRIAVRQGRALAYLHTDALGSTKLVTDQDGNVIQGATRYYAYGREQTLGRLAGLRTDYAFTGQRQDNTGLIYMNARYYDPELGQFISPDTLVPDATNLFDYNRYMYARGNPLRYNDPSGHCATTPSGAADDNDSECWRYANTIVAQWDNTPDYWNERFYSKDNFLKMASNNENHTDGFQAAFTQYLASDAYKAWAAKHPSQPISQAELADPMCAGQGACQAAVRASEKAAKKCKQIDCVGIGNDVVGVAGAGMVLFCPECGAVGVVLSYGSTGFGVVWTTSNWYNDHSSEADLAMTGALAYRSFVTKSKPWGVVYSAIQLIWDAVVSPNDPWE